VKFQEYAKLLRSRWITVFSAILAAVLGAFILTLLTTPLYEASTRLFVSTTAGASASDLYQSSRYSQERVLSYSELITGETLANRTIEKLNLEKSPQELSEQVTARATPNTVLIAVKVRDASPVQARDIANAMSE
jgi:receptor protein-tyrosine kinase